MTVGLPKASSFVRSKEPSAHAVCEVKAGKVRELSRTSICSGSRGGVGRVGSDAIVWRFCWSVCIDVSCELLFIDCTRFGWFELELRSLWGQDFESLSGDLVEPTCNQCLGLPYPFGSVVKPAFSSDRNTCIELDV